MARPRQSVGDLVRAEESKQGVAYRQHAELLYLIHELSRFISTDFDRAMVRHRLTHAQWWALMHIFEHEGATQSELAAILQMGRAAAGKLIERLEGKRWIERRPDPADSRIRRVYLRPQSVPVFAVMTAEGKKLFDNFLDGLSTRQEAQLIKALHLIRRNGERRAADSAD